MLTFGIYPLPQAAPYAELAERTRRAEAMGFDTAWLGDETPMAYSGSIHFEAWTALAALARDTSTIRLGTLVTPALFRHPLLNAMAVSTLDHVSGGRAVLGLGAGGVPADLAGMGAGDTSPRELVERLDEQLVQIDRLLRGETVTQQGGHYPTRDARVERPLQRPRPPIVVAAQGPRAIGLAARHADVWNSLGGQPIEGERVSLDAALAVTRRQVELLDEACAREGRIVVRSVLAFRPGALTSVDAVADWIGRYRELGFTDFVLAWPGTSSGPTTLAVLERFASDVLPALRRGDGR